MADVAIVKRLLSIAAVILIAPLAGMQVASIAIPAGSSAIRSLVATPVPSFDITATVTPTTAPHLDVPGEEPVAGGNYSFTTADGTQYRVYEQTNRVLGTGPTATPAPTSTPTPSPVPTPTPTPAPVVTSYDDPVLTYFGTWGVYTGSGKYGPGDHFTRDFTASYGVLFTGSVTLYTQTAPWMAIASVSLDGGPAVEFDAYAATATQGVAFFRAGPLAPGVHRVIVHHTGRTNPAGTSFANGGQQVTVDRVDITDGAIVAPLAP